MMKKCYIILIIFSLLGCEKDDVEADEVLSKLLLSKEEIPSDGQSTVEVSVILPKESSADRRNIIFSTSQGVFVNSGSNKYTAKAVYENKILMAKASLRAPMQPGFIVITAEPEFDSPYGEFRMLDTVKAVASVPLTLSLEPSSLGLAPNYGSEVELVGKLENASGKFVSKGYKIVFEDKLLSGEPANGKFRHLQVVSNDTSTVSAIYGAGALTVGTTVKIRGTLLDENGNKTAVADSVLLQVINKE